ncbi:MAG: CBS domain-containing protein [Saprospiraceae bacterium]|nr:CBS domain-containing protein [Saprospiraceae bacterium]
MMNEYVTAIMTKEVITVSPENTLAEARDLMLGKHIHHMPVLENNKLVGMLTSWDFFKLGKAASELGDIKIREVMTTKIATLEPDQHIGAVAELLMEHLFHAVPIVNDDRELLGIVTSTDLITYEYNKEYPENLDKFIPENM